MVLLDRLLVTKHLKTHFKTGFLLNVLLYVFE